MAQLIVTAAWGADVDEAGSKFPNDGSDFCGGDPTHTYRVANRFTITDLPADATVTQVDLEVTVLAVTDAAALLWDMDGYNGTGQGNPEADSGAAMYAACAIAGVYRNDLTEFRTTGTKTFTDLGATANADVEAARDAGTTFTIALRETTDVVGLFRAELAEYTHATPPKLTITYTPAGGGGPPSDVIFTSHRIVRAA
jgi:phosphoenolpyruvate-protein kinase (PTS system EI component)